MLAGFGVGLLMVGAGSGLSKRGPKERPLEPCPEPPRALGC